MNNIIKGDKFREDFDKDVSRRILDLLNAKELTLSKAVNQIKETYNIELNYSTINRKLNGKRGLTLDIVFLMAKVLDVSVNDLLTQGEKNKSNQYRSNSIVLMDQLEKIFADPHLTYNPNADEFIGILGEYYCYFLPTFSEDNEPHVAKISFYPENNICMAELRLDITQNDSNLFTKRYVGVLLISKAVDSCFCILKGKENVTTGEICFFAFRRFHMNKHLLDCSIAEAVTISAGSAKKVPTAHRILLVRNKIENKHYKYITPFLYMNTSRFIISEDSIDHIDDLSEKEAKTIEMLKRTSATNAYLFFSEKIIRGFADNIHMDNSERSMLISKLRSIAEKEKYNKGSAEAIDVVRSVLNTLGYID